MTIASHQSNKITPALFISLLLLMNTLCAQQRFSASLTGGLSIPSGRFADKGNIMPTGLSDVDGGAKTGWNGNLQLGAALTPHTWATITIGLSGFKRDNETFEQYLEMIYGNSAEANVGSWKVLKVLAGPSFRLPVGKRFTFRPAISAGIAKTSIPAVSYTTYGQGGNPLLVAKQTKTKMPAAFAYQGGLGWGYRLGKQVTLLADLNFFGAQAKFEYKTPAIGTGSPGSMKYEYALNAYSVSAGVEFSF
jgi:hypothetical protein